MTWRDATLADVATWASGGTPKAGNSAHYGGNIPWAVIGDLNDGVVRDTKSSITEVGLANSSAKVIPAGTVLIAMYGSIGKLGIAGHSMATNQAIATAIATGPVDPKFLFYYLLSQRNLLDAAGKGAAQRNISQSILKPWPIRFPSRLDEQRRIVDLLEDHLSRLDAAEAGLRTSLARSEAMLTSGLWRATHDPGAGKTVELQSIAEVRLGRQRSPKNHSGDRMRPYLRAANVGWDELRLDDVKEMQFTEAEERTYRLEPGDIILTEASGSPAEVGKSAIYRGEPSGVCFQNTLLRVRCHSADPEFVQKYLLAEARAGRFMPESRGVGINHLGRARLATLPIDIPPAAQQASAVETCRSLVDEVARLKSTIQAQIRRSSALRMSLLTAAFAGRLTDGDAELSAAEEMIGA